jgi:hypothetical protein
MGLVVVCRWLRDVDPPRGCHMCDRLARWEAAGRIHGKPFVNEVDGISVRRAPTTECNAMESSFTVRWILSPTDHDRAGLVGTTTHPGQSPAAAALASAESVLNALTGDQFDAEFHVLSVSVGEAGTNLLEGNELQAALRFHGRRLPIDVVYRPLC